MVHSALNSVTDMVSSSIASSLFKHKQPKCLWRWIKKINLSNMFCGLPIQQSTLLAKTIRSTTLALLPEDLAPTALPYIVSNSFSEMLSLQQANAFGTICALERNFPPPKSETTIQALTRRLPFTSVIP
ncbi:hypothetical protein MBANPS3_010886 [Mucor bainieri]